MEDRRVAKLRRQVEITHASRRATMFDTRVLGRKDFWMLTGSLMLGLFGLYALALDQGFLLSLFQGAPAFDMNLLHELIHDTRHAAGFPCH
jgi:cobalt transporter subunit CbtB